jgi:hypothetical protein
VEKTARVTTGQDRNFVDSITMLIRRCCLLTLVAGLCMAGTCNPPPPPPQGTDCGSIATACYDELPQQPSNLICFLPRSRWQKTDLTWNITKFIPNRDQQTQLDIAAQAFQVWADPSPLTFTWTDADADISISFETGMHGDPFPFDGPGRALGHAYFPSTSRAGDMHLCAQEDWGFASGQGDFQLFIVLMHEIGHTLGLEHSPFANSVMFSGYNPNLTGLTLADVAAIRLLYGDRDGFILPLPVTLPGFFKAPLNLLALGDPDSDGDTIPDALEVFALDTDPFGGDTDFDGVNDFVELFITGTPPAAIGNDADGDNLPDLGEAIAQTDSLNPDTDGDGLLDGEEIFFLGTDPLNPDTDGDQFNDAEDAFPNDPERHTADSLPTVQQSEDPPSGPTVNPIRPIE